MLRATSVLLALHLAGVCMAAPPIGIFLNFRSQPEPAVIDLMKKEITDLLQPAQLDLSFHRLGDPDSQQAFRKIVVIRFGGSCRSGWSIDPIQLDQPALLELPALGATEISEGHVLPYVHIYCNEVRAFVPRISRLPIQKLYARALGRVVAHELYHALLGTTQHAKAGLASPAQTPRDLTRDKSSLDVGSLERLREMWGGVNGDEADETGHPIPDDSMLEQQSQSELQGPRTKAIADHSALSEAP